jgi:uncharacterized protein (DUF433 family)
VNVPDFLTEDADGEVHLTGHRLGLYTVVRLYREGRSAEQVAKELPSLPLALVFKTLAFYLENQAEVDGYVAAYRAELQHQAETLRKGPDIEELRRRWRAKGLGVAETAWGG